MPETNTLIAMDRNILMTYFLTKAFKRPIYTARGNVNYLVIVILKMIVIDLNHLQDTLEIGKSVLIETC